MSESDSCENCGGAGWVRWMGCGNNEEVEECHACNPPRCHVCHGTGYVHELTQPAKYATIAGYADCPVCDGTGDPI